MSIGYLALLLAARIKTEMARKPRIKICRRVQRNSGWWEIICRDYSENRFKQTFRVSRETFYHILAKIRADLERMTVAEEPISPGCCLAICLYRLERGDYPYTVGEMTGFGEGTVRLVTLEVCESLIKRLWAESVLKFFPKTEELFE